jgi:hypothetical protein
MSGSVAQPVVVRYSRSLCSRELAVNCPSSAVGKPGSGESAEVNKLMVFASESSGASTFCHFLAQRPGCLAVIDVWSHVIMPAIDTPLPIVAKATATAVYTAKDHIESFGPDRTILFIRDPVAVYSSLINYPYANDMGRVEDKMAKFDEQFAAGGFDLVLRYEDFVGRNPQLIDTIARLGWPCSPQYYNLSRTFDDILRANSDASAWLRDNYNTKWGFGNIKSGGISTKFSERAYNEDVVQKILQVSPHLSRFYRPQVDLRRH